MQAAGGERFVCVDCKQGYPREEDIRRHLEFECGNRPRVECPECPFLTISEEALESHWARKHGGQGAAFVCAGCGDSFSTPAHIKAHLSVYCSRRNPAHKPPKSEFLCPQCGRLCGSKGGLSLHLQNCFGEQKSYKCLVCSNDYTKNANLCNHIRQSHGPDVLAIYNHLVAHNTHFTCLDCDRKFDTKSEIESHLLERCSKEARFECPVCLKKLYDWKLRRAHMLSSHGEDAWKQYLAHKPLPKQFQCPQCDRVFPLQRYLTAHLNYACGKTKSLKCTKCSFVTTTQFLLSLHLHRRHGPTPVPQTKGTKLFACHDCGRGYSKRTALVTHITKYCGKPPTIECPECPLRYYSVGKLRPHLALAHGQDALLRFFLKGKKFKCFSCGRAYYTESRLERHLNVFCGRSPDQLCSECPFHTFSPTTLRYHIERKHGAWVLDQYLNSVYSSFKCDKCERIFRLESLLQKHQLNSCRPNIIQQCPDCPAKFTCPRSLKRHVDSAHGQGALQRIVLSTKGVKPFKCAECGRRYKQKSFLLIHQRVVCGKQLSKTGPTSDPPGKPHTCSDCGRAYTNRGSYMAHLRYCGVPHHQCPQCEYVSHLGNLRKHIKRQHGPGALLNFNQLS